MLPRDQPRPTFSKWRGESCPQAAHDSISVLAKQALILVSSVEQQAHNAFCLLLSTLVLSLPRCQDDTGLHLGKLGVRAAAPADKDFSSCPACR